MSDRTSFYPELARDIAPAEGRLGGGDLERRHVVPGPVGLPGLVGRRGPRRLRTSSSRSAGAGHRP